MNPGPQNLVDKPDASGQPPSPTQNLTAPSSTPLQPSASAGAVPGASTGSSSLSGQAVLKGKITFADLPDLKTQNVTGLRVQQVAAPRFAIRVFIRNCDDLLAEAQAEGDFQIAGLPENVPLDVDIYDLSNPLLQLRAQITLTQAETILFIQARSTALALLQRFLLQNRSPSQGIPLANFENDPQLNQELTDLTAILRPLLGQETLRSLQYQVGWNEALQKLQSKLDALIQERPELLSLLVAPDASASASPAASQPASSGGGSSPTSNQEAVGGTISLEGL